MAEREHETSQSRGDAGSVSLLRQKSVTWLPRTFGIPPSHEREVGSRAAGLANTRRPSHHFYDRLAHRNTRAPPLYS